MELSQIFLRVIVVMLAFYFILNVFPEPIHDLLFGRYVNGAVAITVDRSGNEIIVTNHGGPDLDKATSIVVANNNQTYYLGLTPGSTISIPYHNGSIIAIATLDQGGIFNGQKIHEFPVLNTTI